MDPRLWQLYEAGAAQDEVSVIMRLRDPTRPPDNVRIVSRFGHIVTARVARRDILRTRESEAVQSMKAGRPVFLPPPDEAGVAFDEADGDGPTEALFADERPVPEDGTGTVVGFCDWGFDFTHANFRNEDGSTRLRALWDQGGTDAHPPQPYGYGRLHTRDAINAALAESDPCAALGYHPALGDPQDSGAHGCHVADIAVGNRREPGSVVGLAPGAEIVFVHLAAQPMGELANFGDSVRLLEGLDFVRRHAADNEPCILHLSAGMTGGEHLGTTPFEQAVDAMLLERPGTVLVQSAGNYAASRMHTHARLGPDKTHVLDWLISEGDRTPNELEVWYSGQDVFDVTLVSPAGLEFSAPLGERMPLGHDGAGWGTLYHRRHEPNSGMNHIDIFLTTDAPAGRWQVVLHGSDVVDGRLHAWIERDSRGRNQSRFSRRQATSQYTTNTICNSYRAIAVGAYDGTQPDRPPAPFSSRGPTADGRQKPELAAPGCRILAARSMPSTGWQDQSRLTIKSGTSMAAPWVTGTVALMCQAAGRPLAIGEVRRLIIGTVSPHPGPPSLSSTRLGYGYLDTVAAVEAARALGTDHRLEPREVRDESHERVAADAPPHHDEELEPEQLDGAQPSPHDEDVAPEDSEEEQVSGQSAAHDEDIEPEQLDEEQPLTEPSSHDEDRGQAGQQSRTATSTQRLPRHEGLGPEDLRDSSDSDRSAVEDVSQTELHTALNELAPW
ncbi:MAG: S8 family serine peptidase [Polyangiaceae bacterium]|nr:S8 family serine peptidase [Polyangiaceae bacterium]